MRTLAIGDIHGSHTALARLLREVGPGPEDQLVFLGDYIDRGPSSRAVVDHLLGLEGKPAVFLRGNHEVMILESREDPWKTRLWQGCGGVETLASYGPVHGQDWISAIPESHWRFFERTRRFLETDQCIFVHAWLDPDLEMTRQPDGLLFWEYFGHGRPHKSGKRIICGHTPQPSRLIKDVGFAACIDTGPAAGGWLTCLDTDSGQYWQANEKNDARTGFLRG